MLNRASQQLFNKFFIVNHSQNSGKKAQPVSQFLPHHHAYAAYFEEDKARPAMISSMTSFVACILSGCAVMALPTTT